MSLQTFSRSCQLDEAFFFHYRLVQIIYLFSSFSGCYVSVMSVTITKHFDKTYWEVVAELQEPYPLLINAFIVGALILYVNYLYLLIMTIRKLKELS